MKPAIAAVGTSYTCSLQQFKARQTWLAGIMKASTRRQSAAKIHTSISAEHGFKTLFKFNLPPWTYILLVASATGLTVEVRRTTCSVSWQELLENWEFRNDNAVFFPMCLQLSTSTLQLSTSFSNPPNGSWLIKPNPRKSRKLQKSAQENAWLRHWLAGT